LLLSSKENTVTQPESSSLPKVPTAEPASPAAQSPSVEDIDASKTVNDADANQVKGGVKKTMQT
jgi:hypothetical protein